jgi:hypothetical protein
MYLINGYIKHRKIIVAGVVLLLVYLIAYTFSHQSSLTPGGDKSEASLAMSSLVVSQPHSKSTEIDTSAVKSDTKNKLPIRIFEPVDRGDSRRPSTFPVKKIKDFFSDYVFPVSNSDIGDQYLKNQFSAIFGGDWYGLYLASDGNYYAYGNLNVYPNYTYYIITDQDFNILAAMTITPCSSMVTSGAQLVSPCTDLFSTFYFKQAYDKATVALYRQGFIDELNQLASETNYPAAGPRSYPANTVRIP